MPTIFHRRKYGSFSPLRRHVWNIKYMDKTFLEKPLLERRIQLPWPQEPSWYSQQPMARCWSKQTQMDHQGISSLNLEWKDLDKNTKTSHFVSGILQCNCRLAWWHIHAPCSLGKERSEYSRNIFSSSLREPKTETVQEYF